ncbi:hypothetical protein HT031_002201 [Scenedesmus sp. PABB004]|nr:hypothetical protein HT031_002201 [Scenedesmus sp. PABB004]
MEAHDQLAHAPQLGGVCIVRAGAAAALSPELLAAEAVKLRESASCDLIFTHPALPAPLAVLLGAVAELDSGAALDRRGGATAAALQPQRTARAAERRTTPAPQAAVEVATSTRFGGKVLLLPHAPGRSELTRSVLQLVAALAGDDDQEVTAQQVGTARAAQHGSRAAGAHAQLHAERSWSAAAPPSSPPQLAAATAPEALAPCLAVLAGAAGGLPSAEQLEGLLAVGGSLQQLAGAAPEEVAACTGCGEAAAARLCALLNGGEA